MQRALKNTVTGSTVVSVCRENGGKHVNVSCDHAALHNNYGFVGLSVGLCSLRFSRNLATVTKFVVLILLNQPPGLE